MWLQVPLILSGLPLRKNPCAASKRIVRKPQRVVTMSPGPPATEAVVTSV